MRTKGMGLLMAGGLILSGCAGLDDTSQRTLTGAAGGAAVGGILGSFSGDTALGAVLGAGVGGVGGYLYDQSQQPRYDSRRPPPRRDYRRRY
ncbi:glycine zipper domain-containing protein [Roseococcus suduntuyensis]|uniref:Uncharacterized membrane protein YebE (DUF533 family) n=1 Tax=Roseococcus suduntuyensis TaxID=455361 RepID=A0A840ADG1_9PROT|nr:glycine zipper domain-containing protein [Roseococcus suduntuyensis]MBB3898523.1 uncharacterized membrane protein YebE (DUF533 family) [Roseococcus suduntuyensis]